MSENYGLPEDRFVREAPALLDHQLASAGQEDKLKKQVFACMHQESAFSKCK